MTQIDIAAEWQKLCDRHEIARSAYSNAFAAVNSKFVAIGRGASNENPTANELSEFERTWEEWEAVKKQMNDFVKQYA